MTVHDWLSVIGWFALCILVPLLVEAIGVFVDRQRLGDHDYELDRYFGECRCGGRRER